MSETKYVGHCEGCNVPITVDNVGYIEAVDYMVCAECVLLWWALNSPDMEW